MEYDLLDRRRHPHPLLFERKGKCDGVCCRCRLPLLHKPSFRCSDSDCNFQIHQSCIHFPQKIHSNFHPQHPLSLKSKGYCCQLCGETRLVDENYRCEECMFEIDIKCAIANIKLCETSNGEYVHITHPQHPLTLALSPPLEKLVHCVVCELPIQSGSSTYYFCSQCDDDDSHFHKECAVLPIQQQIPDHPHPIYLWKHDNVLGIRCYACRNECRGFMYKCRKCQFFNLHITCLKFFNHKHILTRLLHKMNFTCGICSEESNDRFVFLCNICHILVHEECVDQFPLTLRIYEHHHDLTFFKYDSYPDFHHCMICGKRINNYPCAQYGCSECKYFCHLKCAKGRCVEPQSTAVVAAEKESIEHFNIIHPHKLTLFAPEEISRPEAWQYKVCDGCMKCFSDSHPSYGCNQCDIFLHEKCAKLQTKILSRVHPHKLTLISIQNFLFQCEACLQQFHGFAYQCQTCLSTFDVPCASIQTPFQHPSHQHSLFLYVPNIDSSDVCNACGKKITIFERHAFRCMKTGCSFHLDLRCATLPVIVRYRFDPHPLKLTFFEEEGNEEYYCDICEEKRELGMWFYSCRKCSFEAHQMCALGEFPFMKSAMHKSHKHPLNLVTKGDEENCRDCRACNNKLCSLDLAYECGVCKFDVHATGRCYDLQVLEGNLVFTNYNVFSRANQPYDQPIQNLQVVELGPFGDYNPYKAKAWEENVFSSIRAFVVYHSRLPRIEGIQIQYLKKGELVWSSHGEEKGTRSEISFDYPAEYLVAIHGTQYEDYSVNSLTLETNRKTYGPFGDDEEGDKFSSVKEGVKIIGIFGTTQDDVFRSIGFLGISTHE